MIIALEFIIFPYLDISLSNKTQIRPKPSELLKLPEFRSFLIGRFLFIMGVRMSTTVIGWWMYELTNSPLALGLVGLSEVIAALSFALYAGHYIDRNENRGLLLRCVLFYLCCVLCWFVLSDSVMHGYKPWTIAAGILVIIFITGIIRAFSGPTFSAMISKIVPRHFLPTAASMSTGSWLTASIVGHAFGGFCIALFGIHFSFLVILLLVLMGYFFLRKLSTKMVNVHANQNTWQSVREGIDFVFKSKAVLGTMTLDLFAVLFGGAVAMVPIFARDILKVGPEGFGWLNAATDLGAIMSVIYLTISPLKGRQGKKLFYAVAIFGICIIIFGLSTHFWLSFVALMISGMADGISVVVRSTILQLKTPDELRGRVMSVSSMFVNSSNELGQFESGIAARLMGTVSSVVFGGCMTLLVVGVTWFKAPELRKMKY